MRSVCAISSLYQTGCRRLHFFGVQLDSGPKSFALASEEARRRSVELFSRCIVESNPLICTELIDEISATLCRVLDTCEVCRLVHPDETWRLAADQAYSNLLEFLEALNVDQNMVALLSKSV